VAEPEKASSNQPAVAASQLWGTTRLRLRSSRHAAPKRKRRQVAEPEGFELSRIHIDFTSQIADLGDVLKRAPDLAELNRNAAKDSPVKRHPSTGIQTAARTRRPITLAEHA
jgi:hypothetical protein